MTHFLVACDKCKGSLSAFEMCNLAESVLSERFPTSDVTKVPLTDGGEGFCEILTLGVQGVLHSIEVLDSVGSKQKVQYGICDVEKLSPKVIKFLNLPSRGNLGIVEMAQAAGLADLPESKRNPWETSTFGVGQILKEVAGFGVDVILLGIGGSSTNDIGIGALNALGLSLKSHDNNEISFPKPEATNQPIKIPTVPSSKSKAVNPPQRHKRVGRKESNNPYSGG